MFWKRLLPVVVTCLVFYFIFQRIDFQIFFSNFKKMHYTHLLYACSFFFITTAFSVERWRWIVKRDRLSFFLGLQIFLSAASLNSFMPSKLGDLSKAYFLKVDGLVDLKRGSSCVICEKLLDLSGLCTVFILGILGVDQFDHIIIFLSFMSLIIFFITMSFFMLDNSSSIFTRMLFRLFEARPIIIRQMRDIQEFVREIKDDKSRFCVILGLSVFIWMLHIMQIHFFFLTMNVDVSLWVVFSFVPIAIFVGLLPFTVGGMGTRDAVLIILFSSYASAELLAGVGFLVSTRYWVPSLVGLIPLQEYVSKIKQNRA